MADSLKARGVLPLEFARQRSIFKMMVNFDSLASIADRRRYNAVLNSEYNTARTEQQELSVAMVDIDYFKPYNDHYGHDAGDKALRKVAQALSSQLHRTGYFVARYGGEEFVIILANTDKKGATTVLESCCKAIEALQIEHVKSTNNQFLTVSIGGNCCFPTQFSDVIAALKISVQHLYMEKKTVKTKWFGKTPKNYSRRWKNHVWHDASGLIAMEGGCSPIQPHTTSRCVVYA